MKVKDEKSMIENSKIEKFKHWEMQNLKNEWLKLLQKSKIEKKFKKLTIINEYISIIEVFGGSPDFANGILENISKEINENLNARIWLYR